MTNETRKVSLWTSINSERKGLEHVEGSDLISAEVIELIRIAFLEKLSDKRVDAYTHNRSGEDVSLARVFG